MVGKERNNNSKLIIILWQCGKWERIHMTHSICVCASRTMRKVFVHFPVLTDNRQNRKARKADQLIRGFIVIFFPSTFNFVCFENSKYLPSLSYLAFPPARKLSLMNHYSFRKRNSNNFSPYLDAMRLTVFLWLSFFIRFVLTYALNSYNHFNLCSMFTFSTFKNDYNSKVDNVIVKFYSERRGKGSSSVQDEINKNWRIKILPTFYYFLFCIVNTFEAPYQFDHLDKKKYFRDDEIFKYGDHIRSFPYFVAPLKRLMIALYQNNCVCVLCKCARHFDNTRLMIRGGNPTLNY